jgi:hypothetical protein
LSLLTEEAAKKRWCPFVRHSNGPEGSWNRLTNSVTDHESYTCLASECMAWRQEGARAQGSYRPQEPVSWISAGSTYAVEPKRPDWMTDAWRWDQARGVWIVGGVESTKGYCGLAGKPE